MFNLDNDIEISQYSAKRVANAINSIDGLATRLYGYNMQGKSIPFYFGGSLTYLKDTNNNEVKTYPLDAQAPYIAKGADVDLSFLSAGQYFRIYTQIDNGMAFDRLFGPGITPYNKDTVIGIYNTAAYFQCSIENTGVLTPATPFNVEIDNQTTETPQILLYSQYASVFAKPKGITQTIQFTNWNLVYPYFLIDRTGKTQNMRFDLYSVNANGVAGEVLISSGFAYAGNNYKGNNWIGQVYPGYGTQDFKIKIIYF